jgi:hypothetical protein
VCRPAQYDTKDEAKHTISEGDLTIFLSKQIEFLVLQIAQQIADKPVKWIFFILWHKKFSPIPDWVKDVDLQGAPITMEIKLHTYFAVEHSKKM